jgi:hypothetical protein
VQCDPDAGRSGPATPPALKFIVGLALRRPGEFVAFEFLQQASACRVMEISWQPGMALAG